MLTRLWLRKRLAEEMFFLLSVSLSPLAASRWKVQYEKNTRKKNKNQHHKNSETSIEQTIQQTMGVYLNTLKVSSKGSSKLKKKFEEVYIPDNYISHICYSPK